MNWMESLGLTLLHFVWQGLLIGVAAALVNRMLKGRSANARYLAACCAMAFMGLTTIATFLWITLPSATPAQAVAPIETARIITSFTATAVAAQESWTRLLPWLDFLWFAGVCALAIRSALSWFAAMRLSRTGVTVAPDEWQQRAARLMRRLAIAKPVRLCESMLAEVPSVIGWLRPVVLIPVGTLAGLSTEQLESILAHELAHVRRHDYLINLLQTAIETLLFYHPAVWWVGARMRMERENCCDDLAVEVCGDAFLYARALANLEQLRHHNGPRLALAATDGGLLSRIARLLGHRAAQPGGDTRSYWLPAILMITLAAAGLVAQQRVPPAPPTPPGPPTAPVAVEAPPAPPNTPNLPDPPAVEAPDPPELPEAPEPPQLADSKEDFIESMSRAGLKNLTVDQLIALKIHGVTPEYIQQTKAMGLTLNIDQLTAFRIHGVTPEYMNEWKSRGWNLDPDHLVAFRIHGVTAQTIDQMKAMGFTMSADDAIAARIHNVTPEFVKSWKDAGFTDITFDRAVALRIHNVDPALIQQLKSLGFPNPTIDQLVAARIFDITPEFVKSVQKRGFDHLTFDQLVQLKQMGIIK